MKLKKLTPNLMVEDVNETVGFYQETLGFEPIMTIPEAGKFDWAMMKNGDVEIMFQSRKSLGAEITVLSDAKIGGSFTMYIDVEEIQELYSQVKSKALIVQDMHDTFYVFRCAKYYAVNSEHDPELLKWWNWKDEKGT